MLGRKFGLILQQHAVLRNLLHLVNLDLPSLKLKHGLFDPEIRFLSRFLVPKIGVTRFLHLSVQIRIGYKLSLGALCLDLRALLISLQVHDKRVQRVHAHLIRFLLNLRG